MEKPGTNTDYEEIRKARIQENKRRLATLGVQKTISELRSLVSASKPEKTSVRKWQRVDYSSCPLRRSSRLQGSNCYSPDGHITGIAFKGSHDHPRPQSGLRFTLGALMSSQEEKVDKDSFVNGQEDNFNINGQPSSTDPKGKNVLNPQQVDAGPENATDEVAKIRQDYNQHLARSVVPLTLSKSETSPPKKAGPSIHVSMHASLVYDASESEVEDVTKIDQQSSCKYVPPSKPRDAISSSKVEGSSDDGYNWRKYGQKLVKGSKFPRSYYKCTYPNCEVKKIFERSLDGHITEIVYKGSHDHARPPQSRRFTPGALMSIQEEKVDNDSSVNGQEDKFNRKGQPSSSAPNGMNVLCPQQVVDGPESATDEIDKEDQFSKRRKIIDSIDITPVLKPTREPCVGVQTLSKVDILDDGYRWRKYGQKVIRGNPNPRYINEAMQQRFFGDPDQIFCVGKL